MANEPNDYEMLGPTQAAAPTAPAPPPAPGEEKPQSPAEEQQQKTQVDDDLATQNTAASPFVEPPPPPNWTYKKKGQKKRRVMAFIDDLATAFDDTQQDTKKTEKEQKSQDVNVKVKKKTPSKGRSTTPKSPNTVDAKQNVKGSRSKTGRSRVVGFLDWWYGEQPCDLKTAKERSEPSGQAPPPAPAPEQPPQEHRPKLKAKFSKLVIRKRKTKQPKNENDLQPGLQDGGTPVAK